MVEHPEVLLALLAVCLLLDHLFRRPKTSALPLPPGPKREFLIGNLRHFVSKSEWLAYAKMSEEYNSKYIIGAVLTFF